LAVVAVVSASTMVAVVAVCYWWRCVSMVAVWHWWHWWRCAFMCTLYMVLVKVATVSKIMVAV
jgi:hypothetical protein